MSAASARRQAFFGGGGVIKFSAVAARRGATGLDLYGQRS
jgi:hypothetical protein